SPSQHFELHVRLVTLSSGILKEQRTEMRSAARGIALVWQIVLLTIVIAAGIAWVVLHGRAPPQAADLEIAAQALHSFAAEGIILSEQASAGKLFDTYLVKEAEFVRDKIDDVQTGLSGRSPVDDLREAWTQ